MKLKDSGVEICCPRCGSRMYGSRQLDDGKRQYNCSGLSGDNPCGFTWHEDDFWRHSVLVTVAKFDSKEEYDAMNNGEVHTGYVQT